MQGSNLVDAQRRSSRVPINVPILVTSLAPGTHFSEICETLVVSAHGCAMHSPMKLEVGVPVHFHSKEGRETMAQVVDCQPMGANQQGWRLGARLQQPENFWGLKSSPADWLRLPEWPASNPKRAARKQPPVNSEDDVLHETSSLKVVPGRIQKQISEEHLRTLIAELVQPLQGEVAELKTKLTRGEPKRSQFEVSLSHIPPEVEEKLWQRLRQDLGAQVMRMTNEQSAKVLQGTQAAIDQKITASQGEFQQKTGKELQAVEQRAQSISADIANRMRQHLGAGLQEFQQQATDAGNRLQTWSEELIRTLKHRLGEEYEGHRWQTQQMQAAATSEASRLQAQITDLSGRVTKLDESARRLESDLESHLEQMAGAIVSEARAHLESALETVLKEVGTRNAKELGDQLDDACSHLKIIQKGVEASASELLRNQVSQGLQSFERSMEELAQRSVERWRRSLAGGLNSLVKVLGEQFQLQAMSKNGE